MIKKLSLSLLLLLALLSSMVFAGEIDDLLFNDSAFTCKCWGAGFGAIVTKPCPDTATACSDHKCEFEIFGMIVPSHCQDWP